MNYTILENKFLLIDNDVLVNYSKYQYLYYPLFEKLKKGGVIFLLEESVKFEFLRYASNSKEKEKLEEVLKSIFLSSLVTELNTDKEIIDEATNIANIYSWKEKTKISFVDCILASKLKKFAGNLVFATENHKDFPNIIFNRIGFETIDLKNDINTFHNIGFYEFDLSKYKKLVSEYNE